MVDLERQPQARTPSPPGLIRASGQLPLEINAPAKRDAAADTLRRAGVPDRVPADPASQGEHTSFGPYLCAARYPPLLAIQGVRPPQIDVERDRRGLDLALRVARQRRARTRLAFE